MFTPSVTNVDHKYIISNYYDTIYLDSRYLSIYEFNHLIIYINTYIFYDSLYFNKNITV